MVITLGWDQVPGALYYNIFRGTSSGGPYQLQGQSNPNPMQSAQSTVPATNSFTDGNVVNQVSYYYVVSTVTVDGESAYSTEFAAIPPGQPPSPLSLTGTIA